MPSRNPPDSPMDKDKTEDRATAAILAGGCAAGVPSMALRYWSSHGGQETEMPVFITWLLGAGRFCLTVAYGRYSLRGGDWYVDTGSGLRGTRSRWTRPRWRRCRSARTCSCVCGAACRSLRPWPSPTWGGTGASSARPAGAGSPCSGTWSAIPPSWPGRRPAPAFASRWRDRRPWRRYPRSWITLPMPAWEHPAPDSTAAGPRRGPERHISLGISAAGKTTWPAATWTRTAAPCS